MSEYLDDYEQGQAVKKWFKENGTSIVLGVGLGLGGIFGWQQYQSWQVNRHSAGATAYSEVVASVQAGDTDRASALATSVRNEFGSSPYAALAALEQARLAMAGDDVDAALDHLRFAADAGKPRSVSDVARVRLARLLVATERYEEAAGVLTQLDGDAWLALRKEIQGDIALAQGRREEALAAYQASLAASDGAGALLQLKIDDLSSAPPAEPEAS